MSVDGGNKEAVKALIEAVKVMPFSPYRNTVPYPQYIRNELIQKVVKSGF